MPSPATPSNVPLEQWRTLYDLAAQVRALAPWTFMYDTMLLAVREPTTEQIGFVSVMGRLGEHFAVGVYLGSEGLYGFAELAAAASDPEAADRLLEIPQVQLSFEDRAMIRPEDKAIIDRLGLKFRGRNAWPLFRSFRPGYLPWVVDATEALMLQCALEQLLDVAPRFRPDGPPMGPTVEGPYLLREQSVQGGGWRDSEITVAAPPPMSIPLTAPQALIDQARALPRVDNLIEIDCFMAPMHVAAEKGCRPSVTYMLLLVDSASGMIVDFKLLVPDPDLSSVWAQVPAAVLDAFLRHEVLPLAVAVNNSLLEAVLAPIAEALRLTMKTDAPLRALKEARRAMARHFRR